MIDSMSFQDWLDKAKNDLLAAEAILGYYEQPPIEIAVYHCQQAAEKSLKAFTVARIQQRQRIHDLIALLEECLALDSSFDSLRNHTINLDRFYIESRYPVDEPIIFSLDEAREALTQAQEIYDFVSNKLLNASE